MRRAWTLLLPLAVVVACSDGGGDSKDGGASGPAALVVGVQTAELGTLVGSYRIVVKRDGVVVADKTKAFTAGGSTVTADETSVDGPAGTLVEVTAAMLPPAGTSSAAAVIERTASTRLAAGNKRLLRIRLDTRCAVLPSATGGPPVGVSCAAPLTCVTGACVPIEVGEPDLEDFTADWPTAPPPDICRPSKPGPAELILGTGQTDYAPLTDGQTLQLEQGPQGGHHIWMAVRMRNLRQSGSTTTVTSTPVDGPLVLAPLAVVFTFDRDEGGYCKVYGLRYQVDVSGLASNGQSIPAPAYRDFLGKTLDVTAEVVDSTGTRASATKRVHLADKILCADGTEACNSP